MCVLKNWKQLFLSKLILYLLRQEYIIYFSFITSFITSFISPSLLIYSQGTYETSTRKNFEPTKYPQKKFQTREILTRKKLGTTKARWHEGTKLTRLTMAGDQRNLAHPTCSENWREKIMRNLPHGFSA